MPTGGGQRAWAFGVLAALLLVAYSVIVVFFYLPAPAYFAFFTAVPISSYSIELALVPALLPLLAVIYTSLPPAASAATVVQNSAASEPSVATNRTLRLLAILALLVTLSIIPIVVYVGTHEPNIETGAAGQRLLGLWGPLLGQTILLLSFGVGVAALTDAVRRHQRAWAWGLLVSLLVLAYGYILFEYFVVFGRLDPVLNRLPNWLLQQYPSANLLGLNFISASGNVLRDVIIPALPPLVVLAYSLRQSWTGAGASSRTEPAPVQPTPAG